MNMRIDHLINGQSVAGSDYFETVNPATQAVLAEVASGGQAEVNAAVAAAKYKVGQSARFVGEQAVQMHGAMGMTNELAVSHHFKRLLSDEALFGDCDFQLARFRAAGGSVPG
jgi:alkylation response protein AidB-like acyl-CoA dehydrogenase